MRKDKGKNEETPASRKQVKRGCLGFGLDVNTGNIFEAKDLRVRKDLI
jgi:hypothetical protein